MKPAAADFALADRIAFAALTAAVDAARAEGGEGLAIDVAHALQRYSTSFIADTVGPAAAVEMAYRAGDAVIERGCK